MSTYEDMVSVLTDLARKHPDDYNRAVGEVSSILNPIKLAEEKLNGLAWTLSTPGINATHEVLGFAFEEGIEFTMEELLDVGRAGSNWLTLNKRTIIDRLVESLRTRTGNV